MTGREMINHAMALLGYTDRIGAYNNGTLEARAVTILNAVYNDLYTPSDHRMAYEPITDINQEIRMPVETLQDCMAYGVAMWLAQTENDGDNQQLFRSIYNQKRAHLTRVSRVRDVYHAISHDRSL